MTAPEHDPLRPKLERAQETLRSALDQACGANLQEADTGELIKLEEVLAIANEAAKEAVSVRRRIGQARERLAERAAERSDAEAGASHREFEDGKGVRWMVFAVHPSTAAKGRAGLRAPYQNGWLAFDCGMETRRLAPIPDTWLSLSAGELASMCLQAEVATKRRLRTDRP
jgi:hypothetical protein